MATFPTSVVSLTNPSSTDKLNSPAHSTQHATVNDEVEAIETSLLAFMGTATAMVVTFSGASTAAEACYVVVPHAGTLTSKAVPTTGTTGTGATITIYQSSTAGDDILVGTFASAGTGGSQVLSLTAGTSGTATVAAGSAVCIIKASCATAYGCSVSLFVARSA